MDMVLAVEDVDAALAKVKPKSELHITFAEFGNLVKSLRKEELSRSDVERALKVRSFPRIKMSA